MKIEIGSIVRIAKPLADEAQNMRYRVLDMDDEFATCQALDTGLTFPPANDIEISDLEIAQ